MIDLASVSVLGSNPDCLKFARTARFESFGLVPGAMSIRTTGTAGWPAVDINSDGQPDQAGTLWVFLKIGDRWNATGAERLRPSQLNGDKPEAGGPGEIATLVGEGWLFDVNRWGAMAHYNPKPGEHVGLMVVAGSTRSDDQTPLAARTDVIEVVWPDASGGDPLRIVWREGDAGDADSENPPPQSSASTSSTSTRPANVSLADLKAQLDRIEAAIARLGVGPPVMK